MKNVGWIALIVLAIATVGCQKIAYKPYLPEEYRVDADEPSPSLPGAFTGARGEYVIYGR